MEKSIRLFRRVLRMMLIGVFAFLSYGCPEPEVELMYGMPSIVSGNAEAPADADLNEENTR